MFSTNAICFEGVCRLFRNSTLRHIREVLKESYPEDWLERVQRLFAKEWDSMQNNANLRRNTGELGGSLIDELDALGVNHFFNLFDNFFDELFPPLGTGTLDARKQTKHAILGWSRNIKNLRDPALGHPAEADLDTEDAVMMLDSARRILQFFDLATAEQVAILKDSIDSGEAGLPFEDAEERRVLESSSLPSRESIAPRFVGRQVQLKELNIWLNDPNSRVWLLAGDGGKGKTAIAYELAVNTRNNPPPELETVIWLSAKSRQFVSGQSVDIEAPNFWDLESALDWVLDAYGALEVEGRGLDDKTEECLIYLNQLPALIILDDVDSLDGQNVDAMNFFVHRANATSSKILLTSRRIPFGMEPMATQVDGFELGGEDGLRFVESRINMYGLDPKQFPGGLKRRILEVCDGSPLFVQDLLRLCIVGETANSAISLWQKDQGEPARRYALGREFEMLTDSAKKVLLCCALFSGPVSLPEIEVAAELRDTDCHSAIQELQRLFLIPRPEFIEDVPRFGLNVNTRQLVIDVHGNSDLARRILSTIKAMTGKLVSTPSDRERIGQNIRQAVSLVKLNRHQEAEETLAQAQVLHPESFDLFGTLGWVYKNWIPQPRITDARTQFARAAQLKSTKFDTYWHWWEMERRQGEWTSAAGAAEKGLEVLSDSARLSFLAGFARSQLAKDLQQQAQYGRAEQEALKAEAHLKIGLLDLEVIGQGDYQSQSRVHRAIVINYERLVRISQSQQDRGGEGHFIRLLANSLNRWSNEHPADPDSSSERQRLFYWFPNLAEHLEA